MATLPSSKCACSSHEGVNSCQPALFLRCMYLWYNLAATIIATCRRLASTKAPPRGVAISHAVVVLAGDAKTAARTSPLAAAVILWRLLIWRILMAFLSMRAQHTALQCLWSKCAAACVRNNHLVCYIVVTSYRMACRGIDDSPTRRESARSSPLMCVLSMKTWRWTAA